jgi:hypothetical protein
MFGYSVRSGQSQRGTWRAVLVLVGLTAFGTVAAAYEITGVQPYALDQPRLPGMLSPLSGGPPLSYESALTGETAYAFDWFLDTAASRIALSKSARDVLGVKATGATVEDWGISGTETFDVSVPYVLRVGRSGAGPSDPQQFPFALACVLELRQSDQSALNALPKGLSSALGETAQIAGLSQEELGELLTPPFNIVGTPFLQEHIVVLDPRPVAGAMNLVMGLTQGGGGAAAQDPGAMLDELMNGLTQAGGAAFGVIQVDVGRPGQAYAPPQIVVPLVMKRTVEGAVPVSDAPIPFIPNVILENGDRQVTASLALDTGGAVSLISTQIARQLGLDLDHPDMEAPIMGVGQGAATVKGYWLTRMTVPTAGGDPIVYDRVPYFVADVEGVDGTAGANLFVPSVYVDLSTQALATDPMGILASLKQGVTPFSRIVLDLPKRLLGLDPMPVLQGTPAATLQGGAAR